MLIDKIFDKEEGCYFLLSSYNAPNILIPAKGVIKDIKFHYSRPVYQIKIDRFYDVIPFIKDHVYNMFFYTKFHQSHKTKLRLKNFDHIDDLNEYLYDNDVRVIVNSLMVFDSKSEMQKTFDKLNYYFISLNIYNLKTSMMRSSYNGSFKIKSKKDFKERLDSFMDGLFESEDISFEQFIRDIEDTKPINSIKYKKVKKKKYKRKRNNDNEGES